MTFNQFGAYKFVLDGFIVSATAIVLEWHFSLYLVCIRICLLVTVISHSFPFASSVAVLLCRRRYKLDYLTIYKQGKINAEHFQFYIIYIFNHNHYPTI